MQNTMVSCVSKKIIDDLTEGLKTRYGDISLTNGTIVNYLGMSIDFTYPEKARSTTMGYVDEILTTSGVTGTTRTPASDTLFELEESEFVAENVRIWFHRVVAQLLYLAKRTSPKCLTGVSYLATRLTRCTV